MPKYTCDKCFVVFTRKVDYNKHIKTSCENNIAKDDKTQLANLFKACLNILRDAEALVGEKALRNLSYLLTLKLMEPHLSTTINMNDYDYKLEDIFIGSSDDAIKQRLNDQLSRVKFSNISKEKDEELLSLFKDLWDEILSVHPKTKTIFQPNGGFDIKYASTFRRLLDKLNSYDLFNIEHDILGHAYEDVIQASNTNKTLGQYFTLPPIKKFMIELLDPQVFPDGTIETIADPAAGTCGFLISSIKYLMNKAKYNQNTQNNNNSNEIILDWDFITKEGLYGKEISPDTFQLASSNMLISTGHLFDKLDNGDSLREPILRKFDIVLSNPPYGIKSLRYDEFKYPEKFQYVPIKTNNSICVFIQAIIYMLKINGRAGVLIQDGKELYSPNNEFVVSREYLMKTCDLKEVIYIPPGMFTYTNIKTCVLYFVKKIDDPFVKQEQKQEELGNKKNRQPKNPTILYNFVNEIQTKEVSFYNFIPADGSKKLLGTIPIENIQEKKYSLNYNDYLIRKDNGIKLIGNIIIKTLGDLCEFLPKSKRPASYGNDEGNYPFFKSSNKINSYVDEADYNKESLIIGDGGEANINYGTMFSASDHCYILQQNNDNISIKYLYYFIKHNINLLQEKYTGAAIKNISKENIKSLEIPVPPLDWQNYIVQRLDDIYEGSIKTLKESIARIKKCNAGYIDALTRNIETKPLGELCEIRSGNHSTKKEDFILGEYPIIGGGKKPLGFHNKHNCEENTILCASHGTAGHISMYETKTFITMAFALIPKDIVIQKYIYYYLKHIQEFLITLGKGSAQPCISMEKLKEVPIPVPSLERQNMIIKSLNEHNNHIMSAKNTIKLYKQNASEILKSLLSQ
jgi:type I restriction-modification system DNA methylase subunit